MVIAARFERATYCLEGSCSIQLSYATRERLISLINKILEQMKAPLGAFCMQSWGLFREKAPERSLCLDFKPLECSKPVTHRRPNHRDQRCLISCRTNKTGDGQYSHSCPNLPKFVLEVLSNRTKIAPLPENSIHHQIFLRIMLLLLLAKRLQ